MEMRRKKKDLDTKLWNTKSEKGSHFSYM